jgi:hypothetical protein
VRCNIEGTRHANAAPYQLQTGRHSGLGRRGGADIRRDGRVKDCQAVVRLLRVNGRTRMRFLVAA